MNMVSKLKTRPSNHETFRDNILYIFHDFFLGKCTRSNYTSCLFSSLAFWVSACVDFLKLFSLLNQPNSYSEEVRFQHGYKILFQQSPLAELLGHLKFFPVSDKVMKINLIYMSLNMGTGSRMRLSKGRCSQCFI